MGTAGADATRDAIAATLTGFDALSADAATDALMDRVLGPLLRERARLLDEWAQAADAAAKARDLAYDDHGEAYRDRFRAQMLAGNELVEQMRKVESERDRLREETNEQAANFSKVVGERDRLREAEARVRRRHTRVSRNGTAVCYGVDCIGAWPCGTIRALDGADGEAS